MNNMNQTQLEELDIKCRIARRNAAINCQPFPKTLYRDNITGEFMERVDNNANLEEKTFYALAEDIKPTPKLIKVEGVWDGEQFFQRKPVHGVNGIVNCTATIEVIDTPKEPKERREYKCWVQENEVFTFRESHDKRDWEESGFRLETLVEKGGGE